MPAVKSESVDAKNTQKLARLIGISLAGKLEQLKRNWHTRQPDFDTRFVVCDDLLPEDAVIGFVDHLPQRDNLVLKSTIRERKRIGVDIEEYDPIIGEFLMAFQEPRVLDLISQITGIEDMVPDPTLYASGISTMEKDDFLNPHIDNSHDGNQKKYRVLNLLYYVTPDWRPEYGGNFELWDINVTNPYEIHSKFNRLVIMETTETSIHSVTPVVADNRRVCVSNYYFADRAANNHTYRHVTTFTGRPDQPLRTLALTVIDKYFLNTLSRIAPSLLTRNKHKRKKNVHRE